MDASLPLSSPVQTPEVPRNQSTSEPSSTVSQTDIPQNNTSLPQVAPSMAVARPIPVSRTPLAGVPSVSVECCLLTPYARHVVNSMRLDYMHGLELFSAFNYTIEPYSHILIRTDVALVFPGLYHGHVEHVPGAPLNEYLKMADCIIPPKSRRPVTLSFYNFRSSQYHVAQGQLVALVMPAHHAIANLTSTVGYEIHPRRPETLV